MLKGPASALALSVTHSRCERGPSHYPFADGNMVGGGGVFVRVHAGKSNNPLMLMLMDQAQQEEHPCPCP